MRGMTRFTGWPEQAFDVLLQLDGDPSVAQRQKCRRDRERLVRQPMAALLNDVADADPRYDDFSVWGYGTMVWWWQHQGAVVRIGGKLELGLRFDLDGLDVSGGWANGAQDKYRAAVAQESTGRELDAILKALQGNGCELSGDVMKRNPRGYPADHPRSELLRYRSFSVTQPLGCDDWLHTPEAVDRVLASFAELRPLTSWLLEHAPG
jgi:hypothetical protein